MPPWQAPTPFQSVHDGQHKKVLRRWEPSTPQFVSQAFGFLEIWQPVGTVGYKVQLTLPCQTTRDVLILRDTWAVEGLALVSSTMRPKATEGYNEINANAPDKDMKDVESKLVDTPRKKRAPASNAKDDGHVAQALRTVYQRTMAEDIPSEMLDLLSKLD